MSKNISTYRVLTKEEIISSLKKLRSQDVKHELMLNYVRIYVGEHVVYNFMERTGRWIKRTYLNGKIVGKQTAGSGIASLMTCIRSDINTLELMEQRDTKTPTTDNTITTTIKNGIAKVANLLK